MDGWNALADPTRRTILERVAVRPRNVRELADGLPVSRPAVSQHLKLLKEAGLVVDQAVGTRRLYRANPEGIAALRAQLDRFWGQTLINLKQQAEAEDQ
ncbi:metalloregulator ArsR/SmtB family transcription factor [Brevundimonas sp. BR2-1]|uniref:ArsR/SmtB family transcription factor n=1 Tax=Brevundimonas sp. BR2-1 TaxID=3031123 RepID=UPI00309E8548